MHHYFIPIQVWKLIIIYQLIQQIIIHVKHRFTFFVSVMTYVLVVQTKCLLTLE